MFSSFHKKKTCKINNYCSLEPGESYVKRKKIEKQEFDDYSKHARRTAIINKRVCRETPCAQTDISIYTRRINNFGPVHNNDTYQHCTAQLYALLSPKGTPGLPRACINVINRSVIIIVQRDTDVKSRYFHVENGKNTLNYREYTRIMCVCVCARTRRLKKGATTGVLKSECKYLLCRSIW